MFIVPREHLFNSGKAVKQAGIVSNGWMRRILQENGIHLDLYCHGDTSIHVINGKLMMILYHGMQMENGGESRSPKGKFKFSRKVLKYFTNIS